ncbi:MAG: ribosome recycling factor [candidate division Zixibacteria bacterium]|nr:ribosome recycling factor [candidate division Zixibacteria bacterium]
MLDKIFTETTDKMHKTVDTVTRELGTVRTGKASSHLLDMVRVEAYGTTMPINQVATVSAPEPRLVVVQAFDKSTVGDIVKGIQKADLGLNPSVDGALIRLAIPALNEERRKDLVKQCKHIVEEGRVAIRNIRRDANEHIKKALKDKKISEDEEVNALIDTQKYTDTYISQLDQLLVVKEKEVMEV